MPLRAFLLDLDGTLVDTNAMHTEAWLDAFDACGYAPDPERVAQAIGMGGEVLVPALVGEAAEAQDGDRLRTLQGEAFERIARRRSIDLFLRVTDLIEAAKARGLKTAIATAADGDTLDFIFEQAGTDLRSMLDALTSSSDVERPKPAPDVLQVALDDLGVEPSEAVFVGDTVHDGEAARRAGVPFLGVATGVWSAEALRAAGAQAVYSDAAALVDDFDAALAAAERAAEMNEA